MGDSKVRRPGTQFFRQPLTRRSRHSGRHADREAYERVNAITSTTGRKDAAPKLNYKVYNIYNEARRSVDRKPEANWKVLKRVVGAK